MIPGRPLPQVLETLLRQAEQKKDYLVPAAEMTMQDDLNLYFGDTKVTPNDLFHSQVASYLDVPKRFYDRLKTQHPDLISLNVNRLLGEKNGDRRLIRTLDNNGRGFLSDRYRMIDHLNVAADILQQLQAAESRLQVLSCEVTEARLYLQLVATNLEAEIKVGEVVQGGVIFSNSEVGLGSLSVQGFLNIYSCTNGAIVPEYSKRKNHLGAKSDFIDAEYYEVLTDEARQTSDKALFLQTRDYINYLTSNEGFDRMVSSVREKAGEPVHGDPAKVIEVVSDKYALKAEESKGILYAFLQGNDSTRWGLSQAVTAQANGMSDYDRGIDLQRIGGNLLALDTRSFASLASVK